MINREISLKIEKEIYDAMRANDMHHEMWVHNDIPVVEIQINFGDWKHGHLFCDYWMEETFKKYHMTKLNEIVTEEDGSDCYSARHRYIFSV